MLKTKLIKALGALCPEIQGIPQTFATLGALPDQTSLIGAILSSNPWPAGAFSTATNTTGFTATQSQVMAAEFTVLNLSGTLAAGQALTLPTVASLISTLQPYQVQVGSAVLLRVANSSSAAFVWTMTTNTGWTLGGTQTISNGTQRDFILTLTNVGATPTATCQSVGGGSVIL